MAYYPAIAVKTDIVARPYNTKVLEGCQKIWETSEASNIQFVQPPISPTNCAFVQPTIMVTVRFHCYIYSELYSCVSDSLYSSGFS